MCNSQLGCCDETERFLGKKKRDVHGERASQEAWGGRILENKDWGARGSCRNRLYQDIGLARHVPHERPYSSSLHYNFCRIHQTLSVTPAMTAKVTDRLWEIQNMFAPLPQIFICEFPVSLYPIQHYFC
jgi:hypothetical protein